jgi:hypothetical protein
MRKRVREGSRGTERPWAASRRGTIAAWAAGLVLMLAAGEAQARGGRRPPPPPARRAGGERTFAAVITGMAPGHCIDRGGVVSIHGARFGERQGEREAVLGGHGISVTLPVRLWSDQRIEVIVPDDRRLEDSQWYYIGLQDGGRQWISNISKTITLCRGLY